MESQNGQNERISAPPDTSCRENKRYGATFLEDLKHHMDEFINASTEEHKTCCFKKTLQEVPDVWERSSASVEVAVISRLEQLPPSKNSHLRSNWPGSLL